MSMQQNVQDTSEVPASGGSHQTGRSESVCSSNTYKGKFYSASSKDTAYVLRKH